MKMKSLLLIFCISGLLCSENVTKREGETVVLNVNEDQMPMNYLWTYEPDAPTGTLAVVTNGVLTLINGTRFGSRLRFDVSCGSMTISNLTMEDTGTFYMHIFTEARTEVIHFSLTVTENSERISAAEGSNVTLASKLKQLHPTHHHAFWTENDFGGKRIVTWENNVVTYDPELRDHLQLNRHTCSLTIINITKNLPECYCLQVMYGKDPHIMLKYQVHVYSTVTAPHLSTEEHGLSRAPGSCRVNCSVQNSDDVVLTLYRGETVLDQSSDADVSSHLVLTLDISLNSKEDTFTCEAANPISKRTVVFNTTSWCHIPVFLADDFTWKIKLGVGGSVILVITLVISAIVCKRRSHKNNDCINLGTTDSTAQASERDNLVAKDDSKRNLENRIPMVTLHLPNTA